MLRVDFSSRATAFGPIQRSPGGTHLHRHAGRKLQLRHQQAVRSEVVLEVSEGHRLGRRWLLLADSGTHKSHQYVREKSRGMERCKRGRFEGRPIGLVTAAWRTKQYAPGSLPPVDPDRTAVSATREAYTRLHSGHSDVRSTEPGDTAAPVETAEPVRVAGHPSAYAQVCLFECFHHVVGKMAVELDDVPDYTASSPAAPVYLSSEGRRTSCVVAQVTSGYPLSLPLVRV
jgi:hypothetical protein